MVKEIFQKYGYKPNRLKVKAGRTGIAEIRSRDRNQTNVEIVYNPYTLAYYDTEEIESIMHHEVFHALTKKRDDNIPTFADSEEMADYISDFTVAYDEYTDYAEQLDYYKNSQAMLRYKKKEIANYRIMVADCRYAIANSGLPTPLFPHQTLIRIFRDAVYFQVVNQDVLSDWLKKDGLDSLLTFYGWITEDFIVIHKAKPEGDDIFRLTQVIGHMTTSLIAEYIISGNRIEFTPNSYARFEDAIAHLTKPTENEIARNWLSRLNQ